MKRLSGWQRLGLVVTICWVIGTFITIDMLQHESGVKSANFLFEACKATSNKGVEQCTRETVELLTAMQTNWRIVFLIAFGPIPFFWLFCWAILKTVRWVRAGFAT